MSTDNPIIQEFLLESFDNISSLNEDFLILEKGSDKELLNSVYRKMHTMKGSAGFLGFQRLQSITHQMENILDFLREGKILFNSKLTDIFLESLDLITKILKGVEGTGEEPAEEIDRVLNQLTSYLEYTLAGKPVDSGDDIISQDEAPIMNSLVENKETHDVAENQQTLEKVPEVVSKQEVVEAPQKEMLNVDNGQNKSRANISDSYVRVHVQLLDKIMNTVGELVINRNQILQYSKNSEDAELTRFSQELNVITTDLQTDIMTTRMQPVGSVFNKFDRVIRDLSRSQGKNIKTIISGSETELDKTLLEVIKDPLTHLIRNSVDHGIEMPEKRKEKGKDEQGTISIMSYHEGGQVVIEIQDDGGGIDPEKILNKAIEKGIVSGSDGKEFSKTQILNMIFHPGFSTAEKVTNLSGRGVGMDVVKSNIEKIGGTVEIKSVVNEGSTFKLKIPLTLAIVPALIIKCGGESFAIQQKSLTELVLLENEQVESLEKLHGQIFYRLRGELVPIIDLNKILGTQKHVDQDHDNIKIAVLNAEGKVYGLIVDEILDTQEIVVKPLSRWLKSQNAFTGATIMGDGRVALILDVIGIYHQVDYGDGESKRDGFIAEGNGNENDVVADDRYEMILFSLLDKRIYGIPIGLIFRLEEFAFSEVEKSGEQRLIRYGDTSMPIIDLNVLLGIKNETNNSASEDDSFSCLVVKVNDYYFGLEVEKIQDIAYSDTSIDMDTIDRKGLLGTTYVNSKLVTLVDIHELISMTSVGKNILAKNSLKLNLKVLLVEDSPFYRHLQLELLGELGCSVDYAEDGEVGLKLFRKNEDYDLIITDIEMPNRDGFSMSKEIRSLNNEIPIIAVSTRVSVSDKAKGVESGFTKHLEKLDKVELVETINSLFNTGV